MDLLTLIEKSTSLENYVLIPKLIREELVSITWKPQIIKDESGNIVDVIGKVQLEVKKNEQAA